MQAASALSAGGVEARLVYEGPIRAGQAGAAVDGFRVLECLSCHVQRLDPLPDHPLKQYVDGSYRQAYDGSTEVSHYHAIHDREQSLKLNLVGLENVRGKVIADIGCGAGAFLDVVRGVAAKTIAVEPMLSYGDYLKARFDTYYLHTEEFVKSERKNVDLITAFAVIEHVADPRDFLSDLGAAAKKTGRILLTTPNRNEILMRLDPTKFAPFFYRTAHLWYFDEESLKNTARNVGLRANTCKTLYNYDLSNVALWLRDGKPTGLGRLLEFGPEINAAWRACVEAAGWGDQILAILEMDV